MEFLLGNKKEFDDFLDSIDEDDKIAILTHTDLDGIASAVFLEEIIKARGLKKASVRFLVYGNGVIENVIPGLEKEKTSKVFVSDIAADSIDHKGFEALRKKFDVLLIDHHPLNKEFEEEKGIIKTETRDCVAITIYRLGEGIIDYEKWNWLACAAVISDMSYRKKENLDFVRESYPGFEEKSVYDSELGKLEERISNALIYFKDKKDGIRKVYDAVRDGDVESLEKYSREVKGEIDRVIGEFEDKSEHYGERGLSFYYIKPKFRITSFVSTILSKRFPKETLIIASDAKDSMIKISARNQSQGEDMNVLMKRCIEGFENAVGGGHVPASAAVIMKKDLNRFKERLLRG